MRKDATGGQYCRRSYTWDGVGRLREEQDELGTVTKRAYDECGRVLTQTLPDGTIVSRTCALLLDRQSDRLHPRHWAGSGRKSVDLLAVLWAHRPLTILDG